MTAEPVDQPVGEYPDVAFRTFRDLALATFVEVRDERDAAREEAADLRAENRVLRAKLETLSVECDTWRAIGPQA